MTDDRIVPLAGTVTLKCFVCGEIRPLTGGYVLEREIVKFAEHKCEQGTITISQKGAPCEDK